jgi:hypothetical protein
LASAWYELTSLTNKKEFVVTSIKLKDSNIIISGEFDLPSLAKLSDEDQVFVSYFIRTHGSIKEMEKAFGVSYPTIKARLNKIGSQMQFVEVAPVANDEDILTRLENGEISVKDAIESLKS